MMKKKKCTNVSGYNTPDEAFEGLESRIAEFVRALDGIRESSEHLSRLLEEMSKIIGETR